MRFQAMGKQREAASRVRGFTLATRVGWTLCVLLNAAVAAGNGHLRTVALSGMPAPGASEAMFADFSVPLINDAGQTAFAAILAGTGVDQTNNSGIWSEGHGSLDMVAREGSAAPGMSPGINLGALYPPVLNNA